jgi:tetratricopeptide (TPR) repeat protein
MMKGELDGAIADFDHAIKNRGESGAPWAELCRGLCYQEMGKSGAAIADFTMAIKRWKNAPEPRLSRAEVYCEKGKYDLALADLDRVVQLRPGDVIGSARFPTWIARSSSSRDAVATMPCALFSTSKTESTSTLWQTSRCAD